MGTRTGRGGGGNRYSHTAHARPRDLKKVSPPMTSNLTMSRYIKKSQHHVETEKLAFERMLAYSSFSMAKQPVCGGLDPVSKVPNDKARNIRCGDAPEPREPLEGIASAPRRQPGYYKYSTPQMRGK